MSPGVLLPTGAAEQPSSTSHSNLHAQPTLRPASPGLVPHLSGQSSFFAVKGTADAGRGAFARTDISSNTTVLIADDLTVRLLLREHRGEVCWECFAYDRGKRLPVRDLVHGFTFCSAACEAGLKQRLDHVGLQAWAAVEKTLKSSATKCDRDRNGLADRNDLRPSVSAIDQAWDSAAQTAASLLLARTERPGMNKAHRRTLQQILATPAPADVVQYQMHAIQTRRLSPSAWASILSLAASPCPYSTHYELADHVRSYLFLLAVLPRALLPHVTPDTLRTVVSREVHNSFGIRSLEDEGAEFFGYGVWPSASYFNHSCRPNVKRRRVGRTWVFETIVGVTAGDQLCISYLNGEEDTLGVAGRKARLEKTWGFECACEWCALWDDKPEVSTSGPSRLCWVADEHQRA